MSRLSDSGLERCCRFAVPAAGLHFCAARHGRHNAQAGAGGQRRGRALQVAYVFAIQKDVDKGTQLAVAAVQMLLQLRVLCGEVAHCLGHSGAGNGHLRGAAGERTQGGWNS